MPSKGLLAALIDLLAAVLIISLGVGAVSLPPRRCLRRSGARRPGRSTSRRRRQPSLGPAAAPCAARNRHWRGAGDAGTAYQAIFRNPLADPFVIGASGARRWARLPRSSLGFALPMPATFAGALAAVGAVYLIAQTGDRPSAVNLLLAGAASARCFRRA